MTTSHEPGYEALEPRTERVPLSFAQQQLWFLEQWEPERPAYNVVLALRITGSLDHAALASALSQVVARHDTLRTRVESEAGVPWQVVDEPAAVDLDVDDLRDLAGAERTAAVEREAAREALRRFDLRRGPVLRCRLLRCADVDHVLLLAAHHIALDGWSAGVLANELRELYGARVAGRDACLPPLPCRYADHALWQRDWLRGDEPARQRAYWVERLRGVAALDLPADRQRPASQSHRGATAVLRLAHGLGPAVRELARTERASPFAVLLAGFLALLHRYTGQDDLAVGSAFAGRTRPELEGLIGCFVNMLVLRVDASGDPPFGELLGRTWDTVLDASEHQDLPFERLVDELRPARDASRNPLFQVAFGIEQAAPASFEMAGLRVEALPPPQGTAKFDLSLEVIDQPDGGLEVGVEYATDLFDADRMERLLCHYETLLAAAVADPGRRLSDLPLLTGGERETLARWSGTDAASREPAGSPPCRLVHELIGDQARARHDAVAVRCGGLELTYAQLWQRSTRLAHALVELGAELEARVGVCLPRSLDTVVALLGVLASGGAYVPLDPEEPAERLAALLRESGIGLVVTSSRVRRRLPDVAVLELDSGAPASAGVDRRPGPVVHPASLAYVIHTSGSTGTPKGVMIEHHALRSHVLAVLEGYPLTSADRVLQFASTTFDASIEDILCTLAVGATVVLRDPFPWTPAELLDRIGELGITVAQLPPAYWHGVVAELVRRPRADLAPLRLVAVGGDVVDPADAAAWRRLAPAVKLLNAYGPTEATITATRAEVDRDPIDRVPIGRSLGGTPAQVLDGRLQPVAQGVPGELCLGGWRVGRGYLGRPAETALRFVPDPAGPPGARMYRTGDLARWLRDGILEFLGRIDRQVKLSGFRVEPGEVEAVLSRHPAVAEVAVVARDDGAGGKRLVAYVAGRGAPAPEAAALRRYAADRLPAYMVPADVVALDALPLSTSGKVDRRRLPDRASAPASRGYLAPRDAVEAELAGHWADVLGVERVGVRDGFFDLGGGSLQAVQLLARIRDAFPDPALTMRDLYSASSVESVARLLGAGDGARAGRRQPPVLAALQPNGDRPPFFCVHAAGGSAFSYLGLAARLGDDQPFLALEAPGLEPGRPPLRSVEALASRYVAALMEVQPEGPHRVGGWSVGGVVAFEMARQLAAAGRPPVLVAMLDSVPAGGRAGPGPDRALRLFVGDVAEMSGAPDPGPLEELERVAPEERPGLAMARLRAAGLLPPEIDADGFRRRLAVFTACLEAVHGYRPAPYQGRLTLLRSAGHLDLEHGWDGLAAAGVEVHVIPGDHYSILRPPHVDTLATTLRACLDRVLPGVTTPAVLRGHRESAT